MPFELHVSNDLHALAGKMKEDLARAGRNLDPFQPQFILTQTEGMKVWLQHMLATELGIAANIEFLQPGNLVSRIQYQLLGGVEKAILTRDEMCWGLFALMAEPHFVQNFGTQAAYFQGDDIRRIAFARKLADLFDQYQVYRWQTIAEWNRIAPDQIAELTDWQAYLWCALRARFGTVDLDRVALADQVIHKLNSEDGTVIRQRMPQIHLFGIAVITPFFLRVFQSLARHVEIRMYLVNPAPKEYWLDDISEKRLAFMRGRNPGDMDLQGRESDGHDLLLNWGTVVRDSFRVLFEDDGFINRYDESTVVEPAEGRETLLHRIQDSIFHNATTAQTALAPEQFQDKSIVINGCYTPAREVEVLYNHLAGLLCESGGRLAARDVVVLVSDIDKYAPYIRSVFDHGTGGKGKSGNSIFPYSIADDSVATGANLFSALLRILEFDSSFFKAEDVLNLLEVGQIRQRFHIGDIENVRRAVREADIHFGMSHIASENPGRQYSWNLGLQRMILGWCMLVPEDYALELGGQSVLPLTSEEGAGGLDRIRLAYFVRMLLEKTEKRKELRPVSGWIDFLKEVVDDMIFNPDDEDKDAYPEFIRMLEEMSMLRDPFGQEVPFDVFYHQFRSRVINQRRASRFATRGITFCSLVPMRSIPFKVVAMLGMNFDDFPRHEEPLTFSLLAQYKIGDRNIRANDNHLFLETLLSAKELFYVSYLARSDKDGSELPPSALVDELIDYVARSSGIDTDDLRKRWVTVHPLHAFSPKYDGVSLKNYLSPERFKSGVQVEEFDGVWAPPQNKRLQVKKLADFLENPPKHYLQLRFQIHYDWMNKELISDNEMFELTNLEEHTLGWNLIHLEESQTADFVGIQSRKGTLPAGNLGEAHVLIQKDKLQKLQSAFEQEKAGRSRVTVPVVLRFGTLDLEGSIQDVYEHPEGGLDRIAPCVSKQAEKYFLRGFLDYVALVAAGHGCSYTFIDHQGEVTRIGRGVLQTDAARAILEDWMQLYLEGSGRLLPFYHRFAAPAEGCKDDLAALRVALNKKMKLDDRTKDYDDPYVRRAWEDGFLKTPDQLRELVHLTGRIVLPIRNLGVSEMFN